MTIYSKTAKGLREASGKTKNLSREMRELLKLVNGRASLEDLRAQLDDDDQDALEPCIASLVAEDYILKLEGSNVFSATPPPPPVVSKAQVEVAKPAPELDESGGDLDFFAKPAATPQAPPPAVKVPPPQQSALDAATLAAKLAAANAAEQARRDAEERARLTAQEKQQQTALAQQRIAAEAKARQEAEERARLAAQEKQQQTALAQQRIAAEAKARQEAEEKTKQLAAERQRLEVAAAQKREAEEKAKRAVLEKAEQEQRSKLEREQQERQRAETEQAAASHKAEEKTRHDAAERLRLEAGERAKKLYEEKLRRDAEEKSRRDAEELARREEVERLRLETERLRTELEHRRIETEAKAKRDTEERERLAAAEKAQREAAERMRLAAAMKAEQDAIEQRRREAEQRAKQEAAEKLQREADERQRVEAQAQAKREADEKASRAAAENLRSETEAKARHEANEKQRLAAEEQARGAKQMQEQRDAAERVRHEAQQAVARSKEETRLKAKAQEQSEQVRREEARASERSQEAGSTPRKSGNWGKRIVVMLFLAVIVGLGLVHVLPFDGQRVIFEQTASAQFQVPVKIKELHFALVPQVSWRADDISIGDAGQIRIASAKAGTSIGALFGKSDSISSLVLDKLTISEEGLAWLLFGKGKPAALSVPKLVATNVSVSSRHLILPVADLNVEFGPDGNWRTVIAQTIDRKFVAELESASGGIKLKLDSPVYSPPGTFTVEAVAKTRGMSLTDFRAVATLSSKQLTVNEFSGGGFNGAIAGTARITWDDDLLLKSDVNFKRIGVALILPSIFEYGVLNGTGSLVMSGTDAVALQKSVRAEGDFQVERGELRRVDLGKVLQGGGSSGKTPFSTMSGRFVYADGKHQITDVKLVADIVTANGNAELSAANTLGGRFLVELKSAKVAVRGNLLLSGSLTEPQFNR